MEEQVVEQLDRNKKRRRNDGTDGQMVEQVNRRENKGQIAQKENSWTEVTDEWQMKEQTKEELERS